MNVQRLKQQLSWLAKGGDYTRAVAGDVAVTRDELSALQQEVAALRAELRAELDRLAAEERSSTADLTRRVDAINARADQAEALVQQVAEVAAAPAAD